MTPPEIHSILSEITYKDWGFYVSMDPRDCWLQVQFNADGEMWNGRKWRLSPHMTKSEIVQTALKAVLTAEEHEAREKFLYKGKAIFGPHLDVEALLAMAEKKEVRV
jgi:hypothetical protein